MSQPQRSGFAWQRAAACGSGACVEVAPDGASVAVRDSKNPAGPILRYTLSEWDAFMQGVKQGEFDNLGSS